ncbi:WD40 repeat-containing protein SMU1 [Salpingoeca rosetta]|uniref:WD40 repeat-containing protein SMU1 n=1 Tax=Salpingoeca rosetta (strain ATCC 50818 / BSB-021) TaxID=946362 RepID=F2UDZ9_SALR5|nr:WD40 repeat-containing protein SMU1 [Salpingoeca rosetta]EGD74849.1 WD40 repeat-containing protein SMU1 [Salpingoeca rosetta]|eukprot:XP_004992494.1 WD40 repeat-containing protein SMU1 [Salpingoeca rosetta]
MSSTSSSKRRTSSEGSSTSTTNNNGSLEIESGDVVRLVLQFLKENNLMQSYNALLEETGVSMNVIDNLDTFLSDVRHGHWDTILKTVTHIKLPDKTLMLLYEQIVLELIEMKEFGAARSVLRQTDPMIKLKKTDPDRYMRLEHMMAQDFFDPRQAYGEGGSRESRRAALAEALAGDVTVAPPSRMLTLLQQAVKWQQHTGILPSGASIDLFRGKTAVKELEEERMVARVHKTIKLGGKSHCESAAFSPDGKFLVSGSVDGLIEVWNHKSGKLRKDLRYQAEERIMMMETPVLALAFSRDSEMLVSASQAGKMRVWKVSTGQCLRKYERAHAEGITCVAFSRDNSQIASSSFDHTVKIHGLRSGRMMKEFRGHKSFVNSVCYSMDYSRLISASSDGTVKIWHIKSGECVSTLDSFGGPTTTGLTVNSAQLVPHQPETLIVCNRSNTLYMVNFKGQVLRSMTNKQKKSGDFVSCLVSPRGNFVYALAEDGQLHAFVQETGDLRLTTKAHARGPIGVLHHPHENIVCTYGEDGAMHLWRPAQAATSL